MSVRQQSHSQRGGRIQPVYQPSGQQKLLGLIVRLGDKPEALNKHLPDLAGLVTTEQDFETPAENILRCVKELPLKTSIYGTLVGLINATHHDLGGVIVKKTAQHLHDALAWLAQRQLPSRAEVDEVRAACASKRREVRLLARFIAEMSNACVIMPTSMLDFLHLLIEAAIGAQELARDAPRTTNNFSTTARARRRRTQGDNADNDDDYDDDADNDKANNNNNNNNNDNDDANQTNGEINRFTMRADFYASLAVCTLAWCGGELSELKPIDLADLWRKYEQFFERRGRAPVLDALVPVADEHASHTDAVGATTTTLSTTATAATTGAAAAGGALRCDVDSLELRWRQLCDQRVHGWLLGATHAAYKAFKETLKSAQAHEVLAELAVPSAVDDGAHAYTLPQPTLQLVSDAERGSALTLSDCAALSEYVPDVLDAFSSDHVGAAKFLGVLPLPSVDAALAADLTTGAAQVVVECIFQELLALPRSAFPMPYYAAVLVSLCRSAPTTVPRALGRCVMRLYKRAEQLDVALFDRLVRWLALHLSNLEFVWGWTHWAAAMNEPPHDARRRLVSDTVLACVRLSYAQHIEGKLPDALRVLVPPKNPEAVFVASLDADGVAVFAAMTDKKESIVLGGLLNRLYGVDDAVGDDDNDRVDEDEPARAGNSANRARRRAAFFECLLRAGSQSFSHLLSVLERYEALAKKLACESAEARRDVVRTVASVWQKHPPSLAVVLDRLQKYGIIDAAAVVDWAFRDDSLVHFFDSHVRDVLRAAIAWTVSCVHRTRVAAAADAHDDVSAAGAVKAQNEALLLVASSAARALASVRDDVALTTVLRGTVRDLLRLHAVEYSAVLSSVNAIDHVELLGVEDCLLLAQCVA